MIALRPAMLFQQAIPVTLAFCFLAAGRADAAPPWQRIVMFKKIEADPEKSYRITEKNGPWMIVAATFSGDRAREQARDLVLELRRDYRLEAYIHQKRFDHGHDLKGRGVNRYGAKQTWQYRRGNQSEEIAVMVGNFPSIRDSKAAKALEKLKYARPRSLPQSGKGATTQNLVNLRAIQTMVKSSLGGDKPKATRGPMGHAFLTTNPLLPKEYFAPKGVDKFVADLNRGVRYNLLDCPGRYTVLVASFKGNVVLKQQDIQEIESRNKSMPKSKLDAAARKADTLTLALRKKGFDAYQFHDRHASMVTIGSFNSVGTPRRDGKIEINRGIHKLMETFRAGGSATGGSTSMKPQVVAKIALDVQPLPIEVPKRSLSTDYARN